MRLTFPNKSEFETDIIVDLLKSENIPFALKRNYFNNSFDINVDISYEYFCFINQLAEEKIKPYKIAVKSFLLPSYEREFKMTCDGNMPVIEVAMLHKQLSEMSIPCKIEIKEPKKSLLYKIREWIRNNV